ncbi:MAG: penicillin-binding protein 1B [Pseudomonadota bacterium]
MTARRTASRSVKRGILSVFIKLTLALAIGGGVLLALYAAHLDRVVQERFSGSLWALPAKVYARAMELWAGLPLAPAQLERELARLGYQPVEGDPRPGQFRRAGAEFEVHARRAQHFDGEEPERLLRVRFEGNRVAGLWDAERKPVALARLDPPVIGSFYPDKQEDRVLLRLQDTPPLLVDTLLAVEDQSFFKHGGVNPLAILRAVVVNLVSGSVSQGGSTITQQLAKNFFLSNERTMTRKLTELLMALEMEWHYSKEQILEAYLNEVWLGQDGSRAIHGFGLASEFYFGRPVAELAPEQFALLVGMVKGASFYNPIRHPERAAERRNVVLGVMAEQGLIAPEARDILRRQPLGLRAGTAQAGAGVVPAFMQLVRQQLKQEYDEQALRTLGLRIYTTLDPEAQAQAELAVSAQLPQLEKARKLPEGSLQASVIVSEPTSGEVLALVGDRNPRFDGFNRALDARRPIGSLVKPAIYLTALEQPQRYGLGALIDDSPLTLEQRGSAPWSPENYDRKYRGEVPLYRALAHSLNLPAVRVGLDLGVERVAATIKRLGGRPPEQPTPAMLLGAVDMAPLDVTQMYQTLAAGGFQTPLRAIRAVLDSDGRPLARFALTVRQAAQPAPVFLLTTAMQGTVREGTAAALGKALPGLQMAGKTGTTNDLRDSWFAGFSGDRLAVVWVGRDDNQPTRLTGASGALPIFTQLMRALPQQARSTQAPEGVEWVAIDPSTGLLAAPGCPGAVNLPYIQGAAPQEFSGCGDAPVDAGSNEESLLDWLNRLTQ